MIIERAALVLGAALAVATVSVGNAADGAAAPIAVTALATADTATKSVVETTTDKQGRTLQREWLPAADVTPEQLAASLRASGEAPDARVVTEDRGGAAPLAPGPYDCTYVSAGTLNCPNVWWANLGAEDPRVIFVDHTGANWSVDTKVADQNTLLNIDSLYNWATCPNWSAARCLHQWSGNYGDNHWYALSYHCWWPSGRFCEPWEGANPRTEYNDYYAHTAFVRRVIICHELLHHIGLTHNIATNSCIYLWADSATSEYRNGDDTALIQAVYSVYRSP